MLPAKVIQGESVRDYAYGWIIGHCLIHQWCSGARGIDHEVIGFVKDLIVNVNQNLMMETKLYQAEDLPGLIELLQYLIYNEGAEAETYVPDQWTKRRMS